MPKITFHGGRLNNKKMFVEPLQSTYYHSYIKPSSPNVNFHDSFMNSFTRIDEIYRLTKVGCPVGNKYVIRIGYLKEGSKTKPETIWKRGLFYSERECYTDYQTGQSYAV